MNYNKAIVIGNITKDPELKKTPNDQSVTSFSVATNRTYLDSNKQKHEQVEFHNIVVWGKMAETLCQYMKKGSQIMIEGRIQTRTWEKDGKKNYRTEIVAENIQFGAKPAGTKSSAGPAAKATPATKSGPTDADPIQIDENDIPF